eukprot:5382454-Karenia_brevis.AAC.1
MACMPRTGGITDPLCVIFTMLCTLLAAQIVSLILLTNSEFPSFSVLVMLPVGFWKFSMMTYASSCKEGCTTSLGTLFWLP